MPYLFVPLFSEGHIAGIQNLASYFPSAHQHELACLLFPPTNEHKGIKKYVIVCPPDLDLWEMLQMRKARVGWKDGNGNEGE